MSSASPGDVNTPGDPEDGLGAAPGATSAIARTEKSPVRAPTQKRARDSPASPARARALAVIGNLADTVRAGAVRGLRAITDSIERPRDDASSSSGSSDAGPPSPTAAIRAATATPQGKKRRTVLTDALTRRAHADWRGARWDYTSAMRDKNLFRVGDTGPSVFAFPEGRPATGDGLDGTQLAPGNDVETEPPPRPPSAMSTASAPAVMSTPRSQRHPATREDPLKDGTDDGGWIVAVARPDDDPFAIQTGAADDRMTTDATSVAGDEGDGPDGPFVRAVRAATALLSHETVNSPEACGALLAFQARLRAHDPYGNFSQPTPSGDSAAAEMCELRRMVEELAAAQKACTDAVHALSTARPKASSTAAPRQRTGDDSAGAALAAPAKNAPRSDKAPPAGSGGPQGSPTTANKAPLRAAPTAPSTDRHSASGHAARGVGRHDPRRAVFCPTTPFGGRIPAPASADDVQGLNAASYVVRDAVNAALRDVLVAQMDETGDPVQIAGVNWTERGNLCMIVAEGFTAAHLLLHADVAAEAAALGAGWKASRDVPIYKAVLCNVPTRRVDGSLFSEEEVLADLRAHSITFRSVQLADSAEQANWIATASERARKKRSTLVVNLATAGDLKRFLSMSRCLYVLGCACEPGEFQPRDRERVCRTCWNPLARHRERDYRCRTRCRLCGGAHAEEDHTCTTCDVLARACAHIPLKCVNCGCAHAADDGACEYRRRLRGAGASVPPMSSRASGRAAGSPAPVPAPAKGKKKKRVRVLEPDEPFPDDPAAGPNPDSQTTPTPEQGPGAPDKDGAAATTRKSARRAKPRAGGSAQPTDATVGTAAQSATAAGASQPSQQVAQTARDTAPAPTAGDAPDAPPESMTAEDELAVQDLVGVTSAPPPAPSSQDATTGPAASADAPTRRVIPPRAAAADADRDGRRRRVAHALANAFGFLQVPDAIAALRRCSDDHASAVSWAADELAKRRKPGMQGKTADSLRRIVSNMDTAAATYKPAKATDPAPTPADA